MGIEASAPGKLVLLGEYAVLAGAPALVLAVDRRARVRLTSAPGDHWDIVSPTLGCAAQLRIDAHGVRWAAPPPPELAWLAAPFAQCPFLQGLAPCRVELDTDPFYFDHGSARVKLGLGSSAALTVALLGALHAHAGRPAPTLGACVLAHRALQGGRGSGIDVAAAFSGGFSCYQLAGAQAPRCDAQELPAGLHWRCVFSGRPASTGAMLARVAAWQAREPARCAQRMDDLATIARRGVDAVANHAGAAFLTSLHDYARMLARLGEDSGADIASPAHRALGALAAGCGVVYKSCGAGGGDVGVTFAVDDEPLREFSARAMHAGFPVVALAADPRGLAITVNA